jgi:predicted RNase H-like HicB family nuclease
LACRAFVRTHLANCRNLGHYGKQEEVLMIFHVTLDQAEDGWVVAECPALPGCVSQGKDEKEALENIKEAITAWLWAEDQKASSKLAKEPGRQQIVVAV